MDQLQSQTPWPHAPAHRLKEEGVYMITGATYLKAHHFNSDEILTLLQRGLLSFASENGWEMHAWAVFFSNHYHFIARSPKNPWNMNSWIAELHQFLASTVNKMDNTMGERFGISFGIHI